MSAGLNRAAVRKRDRYWSTLESSRSRNRAVKARARQQWREERSAEAMAHREISLLLLRWPRVTA